MFCKALSLSFFTFLFVSQFSFAFSTVALRDSIGAERKGNTWLVLHRVESGETLMAIARKYRTTLKSLQHENPGVTAGLKSGAVVKVPYTATHTAAAAPATASGAKTHTVQAGQGLFAIARMYKVSVADLRQWNHLTSDNLRPGQELVVSADGVKAQSAPATVVKETAASEKAALPKTVEKTAAKAKKHKVRKGESLASIAKKYKVSSQNLKAWNHMRSNSVRAGQWLTVSKPVKPVSSESSDNITDGAAQDESLALIKPDKHAPQENNKSAVNSIEQLPVEDGAAGSAEAAPKEASASTYTIPNTSGYKETVENGLAEVINDTDESDLFLALHRTAPIGTLLKVRNQMNNQTVFVKVVGKLPDTGANDKLVVKVSRKAYERLAAVDRRFRVEVAYMPMNN